MSTPPATAATGLPSVSRAGEPAWVRRGSAEVQKSYAAAMAFEQTLVEQLAKTMLASDGLGGEGGAGSEEGAPPSDAGSGLLGSLLPQALAGGLASSGGFGLAAELTRGLGGTSAAGTAPATAVHGATPAPAPTPKPLDSSGGVSA